MTRSRGDVPVLTPREIEVRDALARGLSNKEIGKELNMSLGTVKFHVRELLNKFGVESRQQIVCLLCDRNRP